MAVGSAIYNTIVGALFVMALGRRRAGQRTAIKRNLRATASPSNAVSPASPSDEATDLLRTPRNSVFPAPFMTAPRNTAPRNAFGLHDGSEECVHEDVALRGAFEETVAVNVAEECRRAAIDHEELNLALASNVAPAVENEAASPAEPAPDVASSMAETADWYRKNAKVWCPGTDKQQFVDAGLLDTGRRIATHDFRSAYRRGWPFSGEERTRKCPELLDHDLRKRLNSLPQAKSLSRNLQQRLGVELFVDLLGRLPGAFYRFEGETDERGTYIEFEAGALETMTEAQRELGHEEGVLLYLAIELIQGRRPGGGEDLLALLDARETKRDALVYPQAGAKLEDAIDVCPICTCPLEDDDETVTEHSHCGHRFHKSCLREAHVNNLKTAQEAQELGEYFEMGCKVDMLTGRPILSDELMFQEEVPGGRGKGAVCEPHCPMCKQLRDGAKGQVF